MGGWCAAVAQTMASTAFWLWENAFWISGIAGTRALAN